MKREDPAATRPLPKSGLRYATRPLAVDRSHPFFFDHPLDHVPGLLLIDGMYRLTASLAKTATRPEPVSLRGLEIEFSRYCLLDTPIELRCQELDSRQPTYLVEVWQQDIRRACGRYAWDPASRFSAPEHVGDVATAAQPVSCDREYVGKANPDNVMIGAPRVVDSQLHARIIPPNPRNGLVESAGETGAGAYSPLYLLEAFMQTQRYLNQLSRTERQQPRMRDTLVGVSIHLFHEMAVRRPIGVVRSSSDIATVAGRRRQAGRIVPWNQDTDAPATPPQPLVECTVHTLGVY